MDQVELVVQPRSVSGKHVKQLRAQGIIPLVIYGHKTETMNLQVVEYDARRAIAQAGGQLIALRVAGEEQPRMTLAREQQRDVLTGKLLHVDLYEVDMSETVQVEVPLALVGEAQLVENGQAILSHMLTSVEVECLPGDIVQSIEVDISLLVGFDDAVHVRDLVVPDTIRVLTDGDEMIARLEPVAEEEEEEEAELLAAPSAEDVEVIHRGRVEEEDEE